MDGPQPWAVAGSTPGDSSRQHCQAASQAVAAAASVELVEVAVLAAADVSAVTVVRVRYAQAARDFVAAAGESERQT